MLDALLRWLNTPLALIVVVVLLLLVFVVYLTRRKRYPYQAKAALSSAAEYRFFVALESAVGAQARIFIKVRLADIVQVRDGLSERRFWQAFKLIASKHIDYVLCDADSHEVLCVIELDDRSHELAERRQRDAFVDKVFAKVGIPIFHFPVQARYDIEALQRTLQPTLN